MNARRIVLASSSPYRRELLERLRLPFVTCSPDCDETPGEQEPPECLVERLARIKADSVAGQFPDALVIGSDQVAAVGGRILTKPGTHERAREQLRQCSGQRVEFHTGLCVRDSASGVESTLREPFTIHFRALTDEEIERYLHTEAPYDCAGSIRSEGYAITLFDRMEGRDPTALVGLPLIPLAGMLRAYGLLLP